LVLGKGKRKGVRRGRRRTDLLLLLQPAAPQRRKKGGKEYCLEKEEGEKQSWIPLTERGKGGGRFL